MLRGKELAVAHWQQIATLDAAIKSLPDQYDLAANTKHYFAHGTYVRELFVPANTVLTGMIHKHSCVNIMVRGKIRVISSAGTRDLEGYNVFVSGAGEQKAAYVLEDLVFLNVFPWEGPEDAERAEQLLAYESWTDAERDQCLLG